MKTKFELGGMVFEGHDTGLAWNGFSCPAFSLAETERLLGSLGYSWRKVGRDIEIDDGYESPLVVTPQDIDGETCYAVGAFSWCWLPA